MFNCIIQNVIFASLKLCVDLMSVMVQLTIPAYD